MGSRYQNPDYSSDYPEDDYLAEESTRPIESTPPRPTRPPPPEMPQQDTRSLARPREGTQPTQRQPLRGQPQQGAPYAGPSSEAYPDSPRRIRQTQPLRQPPPQPTLPPDRLPQSAPRRTPPPVAVTRSKRDSGLYLPWWSLVLMLVFVGAAAVGAWAVVDSVGGNAPPGGATPLIVVVTATYTVGPPPTLTPLPQVQPPPILPTIAPTPTLPPGDFRVGVNVKVVGVGVTGLNVRSGAGLGAELRFIAAEGAQFVVVAGPQQASGYEWWEIQSTENPTQRGWAVRNFLEVVQ
ncbi:MAG: hypothetical protein OHK0023_09080 [Anaerolineae bacterium]